MRVQEAIDCFLAVEDEEASHFEWTAVRVAPDRTNRYANSCRRRKAYRRGGAPCSKGKVSRRIGGNHKLLTKATTRRAAVSANNTR